MSVRAGMPSSARRAVLGTAVTQASDHRHTALTVLFICLCAVTLTVLLSIAAVCYSRLSLFSGLNSIARDKTHSRRVSKGPSTVPLPDEPPFVMVTASSLNAEKWESMSVAIEQPTESEKSFTSLSSWEQDLFYDDTLNDTRHYTIEYGAVQVLDSMRSLPSYRRPLSESKADTPVRMNMFGRKGKRDAPLTVSLSQCFTKSSTSSLRSLKRHSAL